MMNSKTYFKVPKPQTILAVTITAIVGVALEAVMLGGMWRLPAALFAAGMVLFLFLPRPTLLFAIYCVSIPLESVLILRGWEGVTMTRYLGISAGALLVVHMLRSRRVNKPPPAMFAWASLFVFGAVSAVWAVDQQQTAQSLWLHARFFLFYSVVVMYPFSAKEVSQVKTGIMLSGVLASISILYLYSSQATYLEAVRASIGFAGHAADPNHTAVSLLLPFSLFLAAALCARHRRVTSYAVPLATLCLAVVLTGSRTGLLGLSVAAISLLTMHSGEWSQRMKFMVLAALGAVPVWLLWPRLPVELTGRFVLAEIVAGGGAGRIDIWRTGIAAWWANPLLGYGFGNFGVVHTRWAGQYTVAHNIYLQLLVDLGLPGIMLLLTALVLGLKSRVISSTERGATAGMVSVLVGSLFLGTLNYDYFWLALMMTEIVRRRHADGTSQSGPASV